LIVQCSKRTCLSTHYNVIPRVGRTPTLVRMTCSYGASHAWDNLPAPRTNRCVQYTAVRSDLVRCNRNLLVRCNPPVHHRTRCSGLSRCTVRLALTDRRGPWLLGWPGKGQRQTPANTHGFTLKSDYKGQCYPFLCKL